MNAIPRFKEPPIRDRQWLNHLRCVPCIVTGKTETEAAHLRLLGSGGTGAKPSDNRAVALHWELHRLQGEMGEGASWMHFLREYPEFPVRMAGRYPELFYRWLISYAEAEYDEWMRMP